MTKTEVFLSTPSARRATLDSWHYGDNYAISIHALREEGDKAGEPVTIPLGGFLSTPSARRATPASVGHASAVSLFLSTPSARRATLMVIRVPPRYSDFYPRPPRGGRPEQAFGYQEAWAISIHALREEGDSTSISVAFAFFLFLSTPSARRATDKP